MNGNDSMKSHNRNNLNVLVVGDDPGLRRSIVDSMTGARVLRCSWKKASSIIRPSGRSTILVLDMKSSNGDLKQHLSTLVTKTQGWYPLLFFPVSTVHDRNTLAQLEALGGLTGCSIYAGRKGKTMLLRHLKQTAEKRTSEIIASVRVTGRGLSIIFADGATANVTIAAVLRIVESNVVFLDTVRIEGDRSYITVGTGNGRVPVPADVLREFTGDRSARRTENREQRLLASKTLGQRIREFRRNSGLTQAQLATRSGTSRWTVIRLEKGTYLPKLSLIENISRTLDKPLEEFYAEVPPETDSW
jgi:putative transcriptional regulator